MLWKYIKPGVKVNCIKDYYYLNGFGDMKFMANDITVGRSYKVLQTACNLVRIKNDHNMNIVYNIELFDIPNETICYILGIE